MKSTLVLNKHGKPDTTLTPYFGFSDVNNRADNPRESFLMMAKNYCDVQMCFFSELLNRLNQVQSVNAMTPIIETVDSVSIPAHNNDVELIRGTRELAKFLRCGCNRVCAINKSGILKRAGIQFKLGNTICYNKRKLTETLSSNPELFKDLHWH